MMLWKQADMPVGIIDHFSSFFFLIIPRWKYTRIWKGICSRIKKTSNEKSKGNGRRNQRKSSKSQEKRRILNFVYIQIRSVLHTSFTFSPANDSYASSRISFFCDADTSLILFKQSNCQFFFLSLWENLANFLSNKTKTGLFVSVNERKLFIGKHDNIYWMKAEQKRSMN